MINEYNTLIYCSLDKCVKPEETCSNGICLTMHSKEHCDGKIDCINGEDEVGCNSKYMSTIRNYLNEFYFLSPYQK